MFYIYFSFYAAFYEVLPSGFLSHNKYVEKGHTLEADILGQLAVRKKIYV